MAAAAWANILKPAPRRILRALLDGASTLTEIAEATRMAKPSLSPHLKDLTALGVLEHERTPTPTGWEARYRLRDFSLHLSVDAEARSVVSWATDGRWDPALPLLAQVPQPDIRKEIGEFLRAFEQRVERDDEPPAAAIVLYGSAARGEATWKSDIDLVVISDVPGVHEHAEAALAEAVVLSEHVFRPVFATTEEFAGGRKRILAEAAKEGLIVWAKGGVAPWTKMEKYTSISI